MYNNLRPNRTTFVKHNVCYEGETIEAKVRRILNNKEPIKDGSPKIFTERKDGVVPSTDIRTDRFEIATEAMDVRSKSYIAKRDNTLGNKAKENMDKEKKTDKEIKGGTKSDGGPKSIPPAGGNPGGGTEAK